jgi:DNA processing protein
MVAVEKPSKKRVTARMCGIRRLGFESGPDAAMRVSDQVWLVAMADAPGWGPGAVGRLRRSFGTVEAVRAASVEELAKALEAAPSTVRKRLASLDLRAAKSDLRRVRRQGGEVIDIFEESYPRLLRGMSDPPTLLRARGRTSCLEGAPMIAIVGSRRASAVGVDLAARFATTLVENGVTVCSGGARGIDAAAHRAVLRAGGRTVVVLGSGLARPYPPEHESLFSEVVDAGGLLMTEYRCDAGPRPARFPRRNRIIAGLSIGVVIIEAGLRSGAMITARLAADDYGRDVMAVPGRADSGASAGCHRAVREGWAALVDDPRQVVERLAEQWGLLGLQCSASHVADNESDLPDDPCRARGEGGERDRNDR